MTFFEYQLIINKIETTNSYQSLRKLHRELEATFTTHFYSIHAINKAIKKFKDKTTSYIIKNKSFNIATSYPSFNQAIQTAETKEQILLLLADFQGELKIVLPTYTESILHMQNLGITHQELKGVIVSPYHYSVGYDSDKSMSERDRLPVAIIQYLEPISHTQLYKDILTEALNTLKSWNSSQLSKINLFDKIQYQINKQEAQIKALKQAQIIYKEILNDTSGDIPTT